jgi:hypothetical protein
LKWYGYLGIGLLGAGIAVTNLYEVTVGLGIFAVGVVLTAFGVREKKAEVKASA